MFKLHGERINVLLAVSIDVAAWKKIFIVVGV